MNFIKKHWRLMFGSYLLIYLPWFYLIEKNIDETHPNLHIMNNSIDAAIPFCKYFIIPYMLWFVYIAVSCFFMGYKATDREFVNFALSLIIGTSICFIICMIYPNGLTLRPDTLSDDIFGKLIGMIYASDTPTNVFPSIHVYTSRAIDIALRKCNYLKDNKAIKLSSLILCTLICLSTVLIKQHSTTDVLGAIILMGVMYFALYIRDLGKAFIINDIENIEVEN